ncbi:nickel-dependent hydrogenase large subunit [Magnetospira sp. QH-2]|uniref:nickel-dependent hydrogenase large subunit n=1 Tax=Magnetospira sp. (strain QH-2) TaxID=1288970 RepID=UPI0003E81C1D|nr:nickel-dependent hydrogenase large subunit [Magnetospira sp. QH-2]CCQ72579.1 Conserved protein of unknown function [Magnetospira sp. QH-2]
MDEGRLDIALTLSGERVDAVTIDVARPRLAGRLLVGRPAEAAPKMMGLVFSICGTAQTCAALRAVEAAQGLTPDPDTESLREIMIRAEALDQDLLRLCLDWPTETIGAASVTTLRDLRTTLADGTALVSGPDWRRPGERAAILDQDVWSDFQILLRRQLAELLLGEPRGRVPESLTRARMWWQQGDTPAARVLEWVERHGLAGFGASEGRFLDSATPAFFHHRLANEDGDRFAACPDWQGQPAETGPLARHRHHPLVRDIIAEHGAGLLARMTARLVGVLSEPGIPGLQADDDGAGVGVGLAETARGLLAHRVVLDGETVADYRTVAPTEWNFHPDGPLSRGLVGTEAGSEDDLRRRVSLLVSAIDPCVAYDLTISG